MEESDSMLVTTIRDYIQLPQHINTLNDIKAEELYRLALQILEHLQVDTAEIKNMAAKQQKFRSMAKLNQTLQSTLETQFQLNELMNPSLPFLRKFMLTVINKFGPAENTQKSKLMGKKVNQHTQGDENQRLKQWLSQEWIHPALAPKRPKYKGWILPMTINKNMLKNNINLTRQLNNPALRGNVETALNLTSAKLNQRVKQFQANEGFSRKEEEEAQIRLQNIVKTNKDDWTIANNKLNKLKKKLIEERVQTESEIQAPPPTSVFKQELEEAQMEAEKKKQQEDIKPKSEQKDTSSESELSLNPLELLRREAQNKKTEYENQIRAILDELKEKKAAVEQWQQEKESIQHKMITDEEKTVKLKQQTIQLKKHVQKRQTILATLEGEKNIEEEVGKLQEEISTLEEQAKSETKRIEKEIKEMQSESKEKMEVLSDLKIKLTKIESEYSKICEQITEKQDLKKNVKIMKSGISRLYYHKKISQMEQRWRETERETKKIQASLKQLREKTKISSNMSTSVQRDIDNILNVEKTRNEPETKNLRELMSKCRLAYSNTLNILEQANAVKMQTQEYEVKVHTLSGKNYKQNIQKIQAAMEELNNQLRDMSRSKAK